MGTSSDNVDRCIKDIEIPRQSYTTVEIKLKQTGGGTRSRKPAVKPLRKISCCAAVCWEYGRVKGN